MNLSMFFLVIFILIISFIFLVRFGPPIFYFLEYIFDFNNEDDYEDI